jgi:hypothetical protein
MSDQHSHGIVRWFPAVCARTFRSGCEWVPHSKPQQHHKKSKATDS